VSAVSAYWLLSANLLRGDLLGTPELSFTCRQLSDPGAFLTTPRCAHFCIEKIVTFPVSFVNKTKQIIF
jgi:hypothetical protein